jgi:hypothetical protein
MSPSLQAEPDYLARVTALDRQRRRARSTQRIFLVVWLGGFLALAFFGVTEFWSWVWMAAFAVAGVAHMVAQMRALMQICPRCNSPLTEEHGWWRRLPPACPACGLAIDQSAQHQQLSNER